MTHMSRQLLQLDIPYQIADGALAVSRKRRLSQTACVLFGILMCRAPGARNRNSRLGNATATSCSSALPHSPFNIAPHHRAAHAQ